jgi:transcriptional regulator with XRE-family HTH domain
VVNISTSGRVPNLALRAARQRMRLSQAEFALAVRTAGNALGEPNECTKRLVQKWESGEHAVCRPNYRRALQKVTLTPFEQLGFAGGPIPLPAESQDAGAGEGAARGPRPWDTPFVAGVEDGPAERLRFALQRPSRADPAAVAVVEAGTLRMFDLERHCPAAQLTGTVARHMESAAALLAGARPEQLRRKLAATGGRSAALAGWLALDQGDFAGAHKNWDSALAAARYAGDGPLLACVLTYLSHSAARRGDHSTAWQLAHTAGTHGGADPRSRAWMSVRAAEEAALLGERRAAQAALDIALDCGLDLTAARPGTPAAPWVRFFDRAALAGRAAGVYGRLGDLRASRAAAGIALRSVPPDQVKERALILAEAACACARTSELDLAVRCAVEALDLANRLESTMARQRLRTLVPLLGRHRTHKAVAELLPRLSSEVQVRGSGERRYSQTDQGPG